MNDFDAAVRALLSSTPPAPRLQDLGRRARRRRVRNGMTFVVAALLIAAATVGVAGAVGHRSSSPRIAVSPGTTTAPDASTAACTLHTLQQRQAALKALEKQLNDKLTEELAAHSPNAGDTDAAHQAVLRELSDVEGQILAFQRAHGARPDLGASTSLPDADPGCTTNTPTTTISAATAAAWCEQWQLLETQYGQLEALERKLTAELTNELASHSPNAGATDAAHQAVLREQSDVQQRLLRLTEDRPGPFPCPPAG